MTFWVVHTRKKYLPNLEKMETTTALQAAQKYEQIHGVEDGDVLLVFAADSAEVFNVNQKVTTKIEPEVSIPKIEPTPQAMKPAHVKPMKACTDPDKMHGAADGFGGSDFYGQPGFHDPPLEKHKKCPRCDGVGRWPSTESGECTLCEGTGQVRDD